MGRGLTKKVEDDGWIVDSGRQVEVDGQTLSRPQMADCQMVNDVYSDVDRAGARVREEA